MSIITCSWCNTDFDAKDRRRRYCSDRCGQNSANSKSRAKFQHHDLASTSRGQVNEMRVAIDLIERGYEVFMQVNGFNSCDLIALADGCCLRVEVKTGFIYAGNYKGAYIRDCKVDAFDVLAIIYPDMVIQYEGLTTND